MNNFFLFLLVLLIQHTSENSKCRREAESTQSMCQFHYNWFYLQYDDYLPRKQQPHPWNILLDRNQFFIWQFGNAVTFQDLAMDIMTFIRQLQLVYPIFAKLVLFCFGASHCLIVLKLWGNNWLVIFTNKGLIMHHTHNIYDCTLAWQGYIITTYIFLHAVHSL